MAPRNRRLASVARAVALLSTLPGVAAAGGDLFWYDTNSTNRRVRHCDVGSCTPADFATSLPTSPDGDMAVDPIEGMVYWGINAASSSKVQRRSLSGGSVQDIFALPSAMTGIAVDPVARQVYLATPNSPTRIWRYPIDDPGNPTSFVVFNELGCSCSPQGLALDAANGFLYWADLNNGKIARKPLDQSGAIQDVVTGLTQPAALALDVANDRVYFSQHTPNRVSYALLSSPTTIADLVNPLSDQLFAGGLELDPLAGTLGELYVVISGSAEIRHCDLDAGCPSPPVLLTSGMMNARGLALLVAGPVPAAGPGGPAWLALGLLLAGAPLIRRAQRPPRRPRPGRALPRSRD